MLKGDIVTLHEDQYQEVKYHLDTEDIQNEFVILGFSNTGNNPIIILKSEFDPKMLECVGSRWNELKYFHPFVFWFENKDMVVMEAAK